MIRSASACKHKLTCRLDNEGRAEEADKIKNEQIEKQKQGKGHWHEEIASDSESIVSLHYQLNVYICRS